MPPPESSLTADDIQGLKADYLEAFRDANKARRKELVREAYKRLLQTRGTNITRASRTLLKKARRTNYRM
jgi:hypothetical protein